MKVGENVKYLFSPLDLFLSCVIGVFVQGYCWSYIFLKCVISISWAAWLELHLRHSCVYLSFCFQAFWCHQNQIMRIRYLCWSSVHCIYILINFQCGKCTWSSCWLAAKGKSFPRAAGLTAQFRCSLCNVQAEQIKLLFTSCVLLTDQNLHRVTEENNDLPSLSKQMFHWTPTWKQRGAQGSTVKRH